MRLILFFCMLGLFLPRICKSQSFNPDKRLKFGFDIGTNYSFLKIYKAPQINPVTIMGLNGTGLRIGLVVDYAVNKRFSFMPKSELSFNDARLFVLNTDGSRDTKSISPFTIELSPHAAFKLSDKKTKPYFIFGPSLKIPVPDKSNPRASEFNATVFSLDLGFGLDRTLKYFNFCPELRYSYGLNNITNSGNINRMYFHNVTLVFIFKG
jgi:hypothetical protein